MTEFMELFPAALLSDVSSILVKTIHFQWLYYIFNVCYKVVLLFLLFHQFCIDVREYLLFSTPNTWFCVQRGAYFK